MKIKTILKDGISTTLPNIILVRETAHTNIEGRHVNGTISMEKNLARSIKITNAHTFWPGNFASMDLPFRYVKYLEQHSA